MKKLEPSTPGDFEKGTKIFGVGYSPLTDSFFAGHMTYRGNGIWDILGKKYDVTASVNASIKAQRKWKRQK